MNPPYTCRVLLFAVVSHGEAGVQCDRFASSATCHTNRCCSFLQSSHYTLQPHTGGRSLPLLTYSTGPPLTPPPQHCARQYIINLVWSTLTWLTTMVMCTLRGRPALLTSCSWNVFLLTVNWTHLKFTGMCVKCIKDTYYTLTVWLGISCWLNGGLGYIRVLDEMPASCLPPTLNYVLYYIIYVIYLTI